MKKFPKTQQINLIRNFFLFAGLLLLSSCFPKIDPRWGQIEKATRVTAEIREKTCSLLTNRTEELNSLRALADISMRTDSGLQSLRLATVFQTPASLRFEVLPPAAALALFIASSDGNQTILLEPTKKNATRISDPQEFIARILKVRILPQDLAFILSARIPPRHLSKICPKKAEDVKASTVEFFYSSDGPGVTAVDFETGQYWTVSMGTGLLRTAMIRRFTDDWPVLAADFEEDDFSDPRQLYPRRVDLVLGNQILFVTLEPSIVKLNTTVPKNLFELKIPGSYTVEDK